MRNRARTLALLGLVAIVGTRVAFADTYTVNSTADAVDAAPGNTTCATAGGACTLRAAVQEANAHAGADVVSLPAGLFRLTLVGPGEELAATGDLDVTESLTVNGAGADASTLDGLVFDRIFDLKVGVTFTLADVTLRGGSGGAPGGAIAQLANGTTTLQRIRCVGNGSPTGGAIAQADGPLSITDSTFDTNFAGDGGAVVLAGTGALTIAGSTFSGNATFGGDGAAVYATNTGAVNVSGSTFSDNSTSDNGASLFVMNAASGVLADSVFERNRADMQVAGPIVAATGAVTVTNVRSLDNVAQALAGGYFVSTGAVQISGSEFSDNFSLGSGQTLVVGMPVTIESSAFRRNTLFSGAGGGLLAQSTGTLAMTGVEFTENFGTQGGGATILATGNVAIDGLRAIDNAAQFAGGVLVQSSATVSISNSTIDGNDAIQYGGLYVAGQDAALSQSTVSNNTAAGPGAIVGGVLLVVANASTITNTTISGNLAEAQVGGFAFTGAGTCTIRNTTITGNDAPLDGNLFTSGGSLTIISTILADGGTDPCGGVLTSGGNNIDQSGACGLAGAGDQNGVDPQLGPLADNGGPTLTHLPAATSAAIDTGNPTGCPATDQRGQTRPADGNGDGSSICDIGAVEFLDLCPSDPNKTDPGICGCGVADADTDQANGTADCLVQGELKARIARAKTIIAALAGDADPAETELAAIGASFSVYVKSQGSALLAVNPKPKLKKLAKKAGKAVKRVTKATAGAKLDAAKTKANTALDAFDANVAP